MPARYWTSIAAQTVIGEFSTPDAERAVISCGYAFMWRRQPLAMLLALIVLVRTGFMAYHYAPETRYMAEIYPLLIAACGVTVVAAWSYIRRYSS